MASASFSAFRRTTGDLPRSIEHSTETLPQNLQPHEVLLKIHAVSLNFRDVGMITGRYPTEVEERGIPCSDCAAEVIRKGSAVTDFAVGDHVSPIFDQNNISWDEKLPAACLGGDIPGVLREYAVFEDRFLVQIPQYLSWEEGALLACAGATAWVALDSPVSAPKGTVALLQGTGGVSMFALMICLAANIQPIITSSSDEKLETIKKLDPKIQGINYRKFPKLADEARRITDGRGVDYVINNSGPASIPDDLDALCIKDGTVSLVGFLEGFKADWDPMSIMEVFAKRGKIQGPGVGSKSDFEKLNQFLEQNKVSLSPIIDRVFPFNESKAAFDYLDSGKHVGKIVIRIG
ncbi:hypothetical protein LCI18_007135 [Fusarium solani-melongenae]|uniref:Uncharacterized protein n=1 Tax=Fusarium solani subsp. cucurbitae TaxID=2747967 RepID=A0ACD3Z4T8_FUSSC|nr:hypothetical protein LCI18_007135 [Fusarium solani-melongenae]